MLRLLSPSLLDRQQAYIDLMANLYRMHGLPFYAAHCGCPESTQPIPVIVFGAHSQLLHLRQVDQAGRVSVVPVLLALLAGWDSPFTTDELRCAAAYASCLTWKDSAHNQIAWRYIQGRDSDVACSVGWAALTLRLHYLQTSLRLSFNEDC
jgi:hypothetical protein